MATKTLNIRIDATLKEQAEKIFSELGLPTSTAINIFLKSTVRCGGLPFDLRLNQANQETLEAIAEVKHMKENPSLYKSYTDVDEMMEELLE